MLLRTIKHFCETTSVHGLGFIVEAESSVIKRIAWFVIFLISISYAGIQLKENVDSKLTLSIIQIGNILRKHLKVGKESDNNILWRRLTARTGHPET